jgi:hypothetical protein
MKSIYLREGKSPILECKAKTTHTTMSVRLKSKASIQRIFNLIDIVVCVVFAVHSRIECKINGWSKNSEILDSCIFFNVVSEKNMLFWAIGLLLAQSNFLKSHKLL